MIILAITFGTILILSFIIYQAVQYISERRQAEALRKMMIEARKYHILQQKAAKVDKPKRGRPRKATTKRSSVRPKDRHAK